jgi:hypothetical protein
MGFLPMLTVVQGQHITNLAIWYVVSGIGQRAKRRMGETATGRDGEWANGRMGETASQLVGRGSRKAARFQQGNRCTPIDMMG